MRLISREFALLDAGFMESVRFAADQVKGGVGEISDCIQRGPWLAS